jgi:hypothetical protein
VKLAHKEIWELQVTTAHLEKQASLVSQDLAVISADQVLLVHEVIQVSREKLASQEPLVPAESPVSPVKML